MKLTLTSLCTGYRDLDSEFILESEEYKYWSVQVCHLDTFLMYVTALNDSVWSILSAYQSLKWCFSLELLQTHLAAFLVVHFFLKIMDRHDPIDIRYGNKGIIDIWTGGNCCIYHIAAIVYQSVLCSLVRLFLDQTIIFLLSNLSPIFLRLISRMELLSIHLFFQCKCLLLFVKRFVFMVIFCCFFYARVLGFNDFSYPSRNSLL